MAGIGLTQEELAYDIESRNSQYYRNNVWQMPMTQASTQNGPRPTVAPIQTHGHGLTQTPTAEHPMMETWRYGHQHQQSPQQHQSQPSTSYATITSKPTSTSTSTPSVAITAVSVAYSRVQYIAGL
ncbi:uncharacterized protein AB675_1934 [Cyphellophora attinorum]|uniref:Uncharacterized protein n=1 Tax=Cyphellophora attinorum TaxID=1664694 RepID=A0A0N1HU41_9EURO|nr:uncharacterized protein AB675_1934 [Phialophora attinorum]KPI42785.1 hypothetical protein AB675_1934 [Phialophora attinorum]